MITSFDQEIFNQRGTGMKNLVELFCDVDDFCKVFIPQWQKTTDRRWYAKTSA
jgi:hypothetical protein